MDVFGGAGGAKFCGDPIFIFEGPSLPARTAWPFAFSITILLEQSILMKTFTTHWAPNAQCTPAFRWAHLFVVCACYVWLLHLVPTCCLLNR